MTLKDRFLHYVWGLFAQAFNGAIAAIMATITVDTTSNFVPDVSKMNFHTALAIFVGAFVWNALYYFKANPLPAEIPEGGQLKAAMASVIPATVKAPVALLLLILSMGTIPVLTSCTTAPSARVAEGRTLEYAGLTAKAALDTSAQLLAHGKISVVQYEAVAAIDDKFHLLYDPAVRAVQADLSSLASPDILAIVAQLTAAVAQFTQ